MSSTSDHIRICRGSRCGPETTTSMAGPVHAMSRTRQRPRHDCEEAPRGAPDCGGQDMRYLLTLNMDPVIWESLSDQARNAVYAGHEAFQKAITESGEFAATVALADPSDSTTVQVRNGTATAADGLLTADRAQLCGYYVVECDSKKRAIEL